jgi:hypothetical protein
MHRKGTQKKVFEILTIYVWQCMKCILRTPDEAPHYTRRLSLSLVVSFLGVFQLSFCRLRTYV